MVAVAPNEPSDGEAIDEVVDAVPVDETDEGFPEFVRDAAPDADDPDERIELVRTGVVRMWLDGKRYRLRRPFFGEFRKIRLALQDVNDEISDASDDLLRVSREMATKAKTLDEEAMSPDEWAAWNSDARKRSRELTRRLSDVADDSRMQWWEQTWTMLTLDDRPDDWPSWITDPALANALVMHWRASPLGRG